LDQDEAARKFYEFIWPYRSDVLRMAYFLCHERSTADDLSQETMIKAYGAVCNVATGLHLKSWLLTILRNTWLDHVRSRSAHSESSLSDLPDEPAAKDENARAADISNLQEVETLIDDFSDEHVIRALQALPDEIRWTLLLCDVQGLNIHEVAELLQVPAGTIKSRAHRGRRMLREALLAHARDLKLVKENKNETELQSKE
jgi:RNA polymerase sigma-70 factor (ECF subfamily)